MELLVKYNIKINNNSNITMSSYYEDISGVKMDARLLHIASDFVAQGNTVFEKTFKKMIDAVRDGGKVTDTEITTLEYINSTYFVQNKDNSALYSLIQLLKMSRERYRTLQKTMDKAIKMSCDSD
tara:strand:- start:101 stop:475 length:375 start_codon:yes stop_codon:yes gene_type:complete